VRKEEYIVYGSDRCSYCHRARILLEHYEYNYRYIDVAESAEVQQEFYKKTKNAKTVPQIYYYDPVRSYGNENLEWRIGGFDELVVWLKEKRKYELDKDPKV